MKFRVMGSALFVGTLRKTLAFACAVLLTPGDLSLTASPLFAQDEAPAAKIPAEQLDSLVAPIALYPDALLSQILVASTYPLEIVQLQQWLEKNKNLKDKALAEAVKKQDWDASIQAMAPLPDVAKYLAENIKWTTDLGNAFLAQQGDVMDAVQRMRKKANDGGNLKSTEQQKVETKVVESKQVIVIQQSSPEIVYVPSYNPTVVYGPPVYPYPPVPYPPPGYYAAGMAISFGVGMMMGAAFSGGGWGWGCGWGGHNDIYINNNNNFVRNSNTNINRNTNIANRSGNTWQHNPQHRGGTPYSNRQVANQYGGTARGDSLATRQATARQNQTQRSNRQQMGVSDRASRPQQAGSRDRMDSGARQTAGVSDRSAGNRDAGAGARASDMSANRGGGDRAGGRDQVGNRSVSSGGSRSPSAFGGGSGFSGSSARSSSARGSSSMGGARGFGGGGGRRR